MSELTKEWCLKMASLENGECISVGGPLQSEPKTPVNIAEIIEQVRDLEMTQTGTYNMALSDVIEILERYR